jgi:hypothetical protein
MLPAAAAAAAVLSTLVPAADSNRDCSMHTVDACLRTTSRTPPAAMIWFYQKCRIPSKKHPYVRQNTSMRVARLPQQMTYSLVQSMQAYLCCWFSPAAQSHLDLQVLALVVHPQSQMVLEELPALPTLGLVVAVVMAMAL